MRFLHLISYFHPRIINKEKESVRVPSMYGIIIVILAPVVMLVQKFKEI